MRGLFFLRRCFCCCCCFRIGRGKGFGVVAWLARMLFRGPWDWHLWFSLHRRLLGRLLHAGVLLALLGAGKGPLVVTISSSSSSCFCFFCLLQPLHHLGLVSVRRKPLGLAEPDQIRDLHLGKVRPGRSPLGSAASTAEAQRSCCCCCCCSSSSSSSSENPRGHRALHHPRIRRQAHLHEGREDDRKGHDPALHHCRPPTKACDPMSFIVLQRRILINYISAFKP